MTTEYVDGDDSDDDVVQRGIGRWNFGDKTMYMRHYNKVHDQRNKVYTV